MQSVYSRRWFVGRSGYLVAAAIDGSGATFVIASRHAHRFSQRRRGADINQSGRGRVAQT